MSGLAGLLAGPEVAGPLLLSARISLCCVPLFAVLGVALGCYLGSGRSALRSAVDFVVSLPLVFPPIATGFGLLLLLGRQGPLGRPLRAHLDVELVFGFGGLAIAALVSGLPLMVKPVQAAMRRETAQLAELSLVLGRSPAATFFRVVAPSLRRSLLAGLFLAWARALGEVGVSLMLGGNIVGRTNTVSLEIYNAVSLGEFGRAGLLAAILGAFSLVLVLVMRRLGPAD